MDRDTFATLRTAEGQRVLADLAGTDLSDRSLLTAVQSLRSRYPAALVSAAVTQARLRERATAKFGADAAAMFFTPDGLEQATRPAVARHRAERYAGAGRVLDLCCGIGGDLTGLARAGRAVHGVDIDPLTVDVARANADVLGLRGASVECAEAMGYPLAGWPAVFCDPSRREGGRRVFEPGRYAPPLEFVWRLAEAVPACGAKVAPGIPHALVPPGVEAEWVSDGGDVTEAALWFGPLATAGRRATVLPVGASLVGTGARAATGPVGRWLYEPDGAVIRAGLVADVAAIVGGRLIDPTIAYVTGDSLVGTPFARGYEVTDVLAFSLKRLRALLRSRGVGRVTVKKRGSAVEPQVLASQLRLRGDGHATVVLTRVAGSPTVLLVE